MAVSKSKSSHVRVELPGSRSRLASESEYLSKKEKEVRPNESQIFTADLCQNHQICQYAIGLYGLGLWLARPDLEIHIGAGKGLKSLLEPIFTLEPGQVFFVPCGNREWMDLDITASALVPNRIVLGPIFGCVIWDLGRIENNDVGLQCLERVH